MLGRIPGAGRARWDWGISGDLSSQIPQEHLCKEGSKGSGQSLEDKMEKGSRKNLLEEPQELLYSEVICFALQT